MKLKAFLVFILGVMLLLPAGCNNNSPQASSQVQKKVLNTYLEGLRDRDFTKLKKNTIPKVFSGWPQDPAQLREALAEAQASTGKLKSWQFESNPFVDEINGQTIIRTTLVTEKYKITSDFDLRKQEKVWGVYGTQAVSQVNLQKTAKGKNSMSNNPLSKNLMGKNQMGKNPISMTP